MTKHYIRFFYPALLFSDTSEQEIEQYGKRPKKIPERAFGWQFFDREVAIQNGEELVGKEKNHSGNYYLGKEMTSGEALRINRDSSTLRFNIEANKIKRVVQTPQGQIIALDDNDTVVVN